MINNCKGWHAPEDFTPDSKYFYLILKNDSESEIKVIFRQSISKNIMPIGSISITHGTPPPAFVNEIKKIFNNLNLQISIDEEKKHDSLSPPVNFIVKTKIEKIFSILDSYAPINPHLRKWIVERYKLYKVRDYALNGTFDADKFEKLKKEVKCGSIKTFIFCLKRWQIEKKGILPKPIRNLIINSISKISFIDYYKHAIEELDKDKQKTEKQIIKEELNENKLRSKKKEINENEKKCILC